MFTREEELRLIKNAMDCRKNIIVYGEEGTGKSAVIHELVSRRKSGKLLYSHSSRTLKESLINPILFYRKDTKKINNKNIPMLRKTFFTMLDEIAPEYVIFDHVELVKPKHYSFYLYLMDKKIPLIIISRGIKKKDIDHLRMVLFDFVKVEMTNLDKSSTDKLADHFIKEFKINVNCMDDFKKDIYRFSGGNPKMVKELCFMAKDTKYHSYDNCNVKLIDLDYRIHKAIRSKYL